MNTFQKIGALLFSLSLLYPQTAFLYSQDQFLTTGYQYRSSFELKDVARPMVVELAEPINGEFRITDEDFFVPIQMKTKTSVTVPVEVTVCRNDVCKKDNSISDGNQLTTYDFSLEKEGVNSGSITLTYPSQITTNAVTFLVAQDSYRPSSYAIYVDGKLLLNKTEHDTFFPVMSGKEFTIKFNYMQPVRFTEAAFKQEVQVTTKTRFVYVPGKKYFLYTQPTHTFQTNPSSSGNLFDEKNPFEVITLTKKDEKNPYYREEDSDRDSVSNNRDNCPYVHNVDQKDGNSNGVGDLCDDYDYDGVVTVKDNCPELYNPVQEDKDGDKIGDMCDPEESRITEAYPWLLWVVFTIVIAAIGGMGYSTYKAIKNKAF